MILSIIFLFIVHRLGYVQKERLVLSRGGFNILSGSNFLAVAVEEGDVDASTFIVVLKVDNVGFVEEVGIEDDRAVLAMRDRNRFGPGVLQKSLNLVFVLIVIVFGKVPIIGRFLIPHYQPA